MIRFNIIGTGFLDFEEGGGLAFKAENPFFRFADVSLSRSVEFSIPATDRNRALLNFGEDVIATGDMIRVQHAAQMVYDGGAKLGTLAITGYEGEAFKCIFYIGAADWVERLQELKLADCVTSYTKGILWSSATTPVAANAADPTEECQIIEYDNGMSVQPVSWQLVPSVNVKTFLQDILTNLGVTFTSSLASSFWMVSGSMNGGDVDSITFAVTGTTAATVTQTQTYFQVVDIKLEWARMNIFGVWTGGGSTTAKAFQALEDVEITFPSSVSAPLFMIEYDTKLKRCTVLGGKSSSGLVFGIEPLDGRTINVTEGHIFFFAESAMTNTDSNGLYYGWKDIAYPVSLACTVARTQDLSIGEVWQLRNNMPDCTVFEFLKSVALATGLELQVDPETGITLAEGSYGQSGDFVNLDKVTSIDAVSRIVDAWGNNTRKATIVFDSEDYVKLPIVAAFEVDNENTEEEKENKVFFSEGEYGDNGVLIEDVDASGSSYAFAGTKWTLARVDASLTTLQRVETPAPVGYDDIVNNSTAVRVKVAAPEADFFGLQPSTTFLWRGSPFVWTSADWSAGILSLTLQRVSVQTYHP